MRVLSLLPFFTFGGAEKQARILAEALHASGDDVEVWAFERADGDDPLQERLEAAGIRTRLLPFRLERLSADRGMALTALALSALVHRGGFDVVLPWTYYPNVLAGLLPYFGYRGGVIWNQRGVDDIVRPTAWEDLIDRSRTCWASNSETGAAFVCRRFGVKPDDITVVRNALAPLVPRYGRETWRRRLQASADDVVVTMVANLFPNKRHAVVLEGLAILRKSGLRVVVALAGYAPAPQFEAAVRAAIGAMGPHVRMLGSVADVAGLLQATDIATLASNSTEGCSNSILEYMASGLPVVCSRLPAFVEMMPPDHDAFFDVDDAGGFASAVQRLIERPALAAQMGERLRTHVAERFGGGQMVVSWARLLARAADLSR
ncbi:MAG: glycosyltransferase family 4 protein [Deltaproteobacteria bacterium]|nr:glycosyltransferase family 4 protein [Deltaproteobacteria bacterium]